MRTTFHRVALVFALATGAAACGQDTTAPDGAASQAIDEAALSYQGPLTTAEYWRDEAALLAATPDAPFLSMPHSMRPDSMRPGDGRHAMRHGPGGLVIHLLHRSLRDFAETNGDSAARALAQPVHDLLAAARDAFHAGDSAAAAALVQQAYTAAATIVIELEGTAPLDRLSEMVDSGLVRLDAIIARAEDAGRDVERIEALREFVTSLHAEAATLRAGGDPPGALVTESIAAQSLGRALYHARHRGRGEHGGDRGGRGDHEHRGDRFHN